MSIQCAPGPSFFPMSVGFVFSNIISYEAFGYPTENLEILGAGGPSLITLFEAAYSIVKIKMPYNDITTLLGSSRYSYSIDADDMRKANDI